MRKYTLVFSIVVHAMLVCAAIVVPVVATTVVPRPLERIRIVLAEPEMPAAPPVRPVRPRRAVNPHAAPIEEPLALTPEAPAPPAESYVIDEAAGLATGGPAVVVPWVGVVGGEVPPPAPLKPPVPVRVGGVVRAPEKLHHVSPVYPSLALAARVEGIVILEALIGVDGDVRDVRVLRSHPLLDASAEAAVRQWRYRPTSLNNQPVPLLMTVTVSFTLR